jgi:hypothetical protein
MWQSVERNMGMRGRSMRGGFLGCLCRVWFSDVVWVRSEERGRSREGVIAGDGKGKRHVYSYRCCERVLKTCVFSGTDHCRL